MNRANLKGNQVKPRNYITLTCLAAGMAAMSAQTAWAQTDHDSHTGTETPAASQSQQPAPAAGEHANVLGVHNGAHASPGRQAQAASHDGHSSATAPMDHGSMRMQGGSAPADARDPHAYSGGYTLGVGKYAPASQRLLRLNDEHSFGSVLIDSLERVNGKDGVSTNYDMQAWFGRDYNRLVLKAEGDIADGKLEEARTELLWGHALASYWDVQLGVRHDSGDGPNRTWLAVGVQGLAPYWFEVDATAYIGDAGRTALRVEAEYDVLLTQKLVLQPSTEWSFYGKADPTKGIGSGLTDASAGVRLRYEFSRQFAPYLGVEWTRKFGSTASMAKTAGARSNDTRWVAGVRFWF
jgi:copper resistance protein B